MILGLLQEHLPPIPSFTVPYNAPGRDMMARQYNDSLGFEKVNKMMTSTSGLKLTFHVSAPFAAPAFTVTCDHPCTPTSMSFAVSGGNGYQQSFSQTDQAPAILTPNVGVTITVRSRDNNNPATHATVEPYVAPPMQQ